MLGRSPTGPLAGVATALLGKGRGRGQAAKVGAATGLGAALDERRGGIVRELQEQGIDTNSFEVMDYLDRNPEAWANAETVADKRAAAIGIAAAISGGVAGKIGQIAGKGSIPRALGYIAAETPISSVLEGAGEAGAQLYSGQKLNPQDIALEMIGSSGMSAPVTTASAAASAMQARPPELNDRTRALAAKEAKIIADSLPFGGEANIVTGEVMQEDGSWAGSAEFIPDVSGQGERLIINIDNLILRSDGTRSGIKAQLLQDVTHELSGHGLAQRMFTGNENFFDQAFKANEDLIKPWFEKSAYNEGPEPLDFKEDRKIVYEEWMSSLAEMDAKVLRRIELSIVNYLHKLIGKDATAKLLKSWDARNITVRNMARAYMKQVRDNKAAGEEARVQTITAEQSQALDRPIEGDSIRESRGNIQDPSRRKFMKQAAGAVAGAAVDPSILLEPATPPVAPPGFGGFGAGPGIAPEYEAMVKAGEMASPSSLVSDVASEAFDDFDADVALEEDKARQAGLEEYDARQAEEAEAETDAERYVETVDEIMNIYDDDASAIEAAQDGTLNDRIISYAAETTFTREELWEGVNERIDALAEDTARPARRFSRARKPKSETVQRDINEEKGKVNRRIIAADIEDAEKELRKNLLKRLQTIMGSPARSRCI
jgi:hypothetical protein